MNNRGLAYALSRAISRCLFAYSLLPLAQFSLFLFSILPRILTHFFPVFFLYLIRSRTTYLSHNSRLPVSLLHHYTTRFSWELSPKNKFYFTWLVRIPKNSHYNLPINVFKARCMKTCIAFVGPWWIKGGGDELFIAPNRFELSWKVIPS